MKRFLKKNNDSKFEEVKFEEELELSEEELDKIEEEKLDKIEEEELGEIERLYNINKKGLSKNTKLTKKSIITNACIIIAGVALGATLFSSCNKENNNSNNQTTIESTQENDNLNDEVEKPSTEVEEPIVETETPSVEEEITKLTVEEFDKLVEKVEVANKEAGLNLKRENLELVIYINNIDKATKELVEKIESSYNYNEEDMINVYLKTVTAYNNDKLEYYTGEDTKCADASLMFTDKIDKETIKYIDSSFEELYKITSNDTKVELSMEKFRKMVKNIMVRNEELGIKLSEKVVEIAVYQRNSEHATKDVETYVKSIKLAEGQTLETIDNNALNIYKAFNEESSEDFQLSDLEYESYYVGNVVNELKGYTRENNTINGYTKDQLTTGGLFTAKLMIDDAFAYFATTGYANSYESDITSIAEANFDSIIARTYAILGSKAALVECEDKTLVK